MDAAVRYQPQAKASFVTILMEVDERATSHPFSANLADWLSRPDGVWSAYWCEYPAVSTANALRLSLA